MFKSFPLEMQTDLLCRTSSLSSTNFETEQLQDSTIHYQQSQDKNPINNCTQKSANTSYNTSSLQDSTANKDEIECHFQQIIRFMTTILEFRQDSVLTLGLKLPQLAINFRQNNQLLRGLSAINFIRILQLYPLG